LVKTGGSKLHYLQAYLKKIRKDIHALQTRVRPSGAVCNIKLVEKPSFAPSSSASSLQRLKGVTVFLYVLKSYDVLKPLKSYI
jgi:hypothetical protein